jgi:AAA+ ATPase superfamily predicted ATPase
MEQCIDAFAIFGGFGKELNLDTPLETLIVTHILDNYGELYNDIAFQIQDDNDIRKLLSAIAIGDRRIHSAFKRAHLSPSRGSDALNFLRENNIIEIERSREKPPEKLYPKQQLKREVARHRISHKLRFRLPYLRFWFYFIAPRHKEIEKGNFEGVLQAYEQHRQAFSGYLFEELSNLLLIYTNKNHIINSGSYWDRNVEIDILALSDTEETIVGECKWRNHKINKKELHKLQEKCERLEIIPDLIILFSKRGFSNELLSIASEKLKLYSAEDFKMLLADNP